MSEQEKKLEEIEATLSALSVLEMSKLKQLLEEKWDVKASSGAPVMMAGPVASGPEAAKEESTEFDVLLEEFPQAKKIAVIKVVREVTGLGLKEAKELVEGAPKPVKEAAGKAEAEEIKSKMEEAGAKVALKGL